MPEGTVAIPGQIIKKPAGRVNTITSDIQEARKISLMLADPNQTREETFLRFQAMGERIAVSTEIANAAAEHVRRGKLMIAACLIDDLR
jgi:hypothetical protein